LKEIIDLFGFGVGEVYQVPLRNGVVVFSWVLLEQEGQNCLIFVSSFNCLVNDLDFHFVSVTRNRVLSFKLLLEMKFTWCVNSDLHRIINSSIEIVNGSETVSLRLPILVFSEFDSEHVVFVNDVNLVSRHVDVVELGIEPK
jgi:hypothetical protein